MEELIDDFKNHEPVESTVWEGWRTVASILVLIIFLLSLLNSLGSISYVYRNTIETFLHFFLHYVSAIAFCAGAILFLTDKKLGWLLCLLGSLTASSYGVKLMITEQSNLITTLLLVTLCFGLTVLLFAGEFQRKYGFHRREITWTLTTFGIILIAIIVDRF